VILAWVAIAIIVLALIGYLIWESREEMRREKKLAEFLKKRYQNENQDEDETRS
jgi:uncharacterized iron-regulated membrane protein